MNTERLIWLVVFSIVLRSGHELKAIEPRPWKVEVDILHGADYGGRYGRFSKGHVHVDKQDRLWLPVLLIFPDKKQNTDAYRPRQKIATFLSEDKGRTWKITKKASPAPIYKQVKMPDGDIIELGSRGWIRHRRSEIRRLHDKGYFVWDLGAKNNYCAIHYDLWEKRSSDGGKTWRKRDIYKQLPFFAHFVARGPLRLLDDGTLIFLAYGYGKDRRRFSDSGKVFKTVFGRSNVYCVRSTDGGKSWKAVLAADGRFSSTDSGFTETFPVIQTNGKLFLVLRTGLGNPAYTVTSSNGGGIWSKPFRTPIPAKHPLPTLLRDGTIVVSYQRRIAIPYGVRARFTSNYGKTWSQEIVLRDKVPISDGLAEPNTVEFSDGSLFTAFQGCKFDDKGRRWEFIGGCHWSRSYRKPYAPKLKLPKRIKQFNAKRDK